MELYADLLLTTRNIAAPRLSLVYNYLQIGGVRLSMAKYYSAGLNDFRLTPELHFSFYGFVGFSIGYSFGLSGHHFDELGRFRCGFTINFMKQQE